MNLRRTCVPYSNYECGIIIHSSGVNTWRDQLKPTQLLQNVARFKGFPPPVLSEDGSSIRYGGKDYSLDEFGKHTAMGCRLVARYSSTCMLLGLRYGGGGQSSTLTPQGIPCTWLSNKSPIILEFYSHVRCQNGHVFLSGLCFTWPF